MAATASPSKRPRSPEHPASAVFNSAPPSKLTHSPSTRDSSAFTTTSAATSSAAGGTPASYSMAAMMQQAAEYDSKPPYPPSSSAANTSSASTRVHHPPRSATTTTTSNSAAAGRIFSDSPAAATHGAPSTSSQPSSIPTPSSSSTPSNYRIAASHSGSTTSGGFSAGGSASSSYDGNSSSIGGGSYAVYSNDPLEPGSAVPSSAGSAHGLGVHVQGPGYGSGSGYASASASASRLPPSHHQHQQHHVPHPHHPPSSSTQQQHYYAQPYGYQSSSAASSHQPHYTSSPSLSGAFHPASATTPGQAYPSTASSHHIVAGGHHSTSGPYAMSQHHRRSIAGQSAGGSSYHSGASASPGSHRRSDDLMDGTFTSGAISLTSSAGGGPPSSSSVPYSTPITEAAPSPGATHRMHPQSGGWSSHQQQHVNPSVSMPGSAQMAHASVPSPTAVAYSRGAQTTGGSPVHQNQITSAQNYQAIVDEIMNQTRKGTDYGLDLGDFEMLDTLGTGTFGRVLLVRLHPRASSVAGLNAAMPHYFAMKVLSKAEVVRLKQVEHISCERSILGAVDHPGIVNLFCTFQDNLNIYMLLEFVQGGELFSHLRRAVRFSADVTRFYAANIILVLEYLHNRNLIYRDLKPENLLLDSIGYLKVTDFGFAKYVPDRTFTLCGTPEYLAPEIINSAGHGKAADWWAFGVLLFEMLCGYPPFFDESPWGIYEKILAGNFSFPPHVDPVARDLIRRLLSSDRSKRLGNLRGGASDVKNHQWFEGVDWLAVERRAIPAPIVPRIKSTSDSQNFERYPSIPIETLPGLARAKGIQVTEEPDPYEHMFVNF